MTYLLSFASPLLFNLSYSIVHDTELFSISYRYHDFSPLKLCTHYLLYLCYFFFIRQLGNSCSSFKSCMKITFSRKYSLISPNMHWMPLLWANHSTLFSHTTIDFFVQLYPPQNCKFSLRKQIQACLVHYCKALNNV